MVFKKYLVPNFSPETSLSVKTSHYALILKQQDWQQKKHKECQFVELNPNESEIKDVNNCECFPDCNAD